MYTLCPFSIASNIGLLVCVATTKKFHKTLNYFQCCLACSEAYISIMWAVGNSVSGNEGLCTFFGSTHQFFINSSSCWSFLIPLYSYMIIMYSSGTADDLWYFFHAYGWGVPAILTVLTFVFQAAWSRGNIMGDATYQCWISSQYPELRIALFYVPLWIHFGLIIAIFACIFAKIRYVEKQLSENTKSASGSKLGHPSSQSNTRALHKTPNNRILLWKSSCLAIGFIFTWTPAMATRIIGLIPGAEVPEWLSILVGFYKVCKSLGNPHSGAHKIALSQTTLGVIHDIMYRLCPFSIASNIGLLVCVASA
ncbi:hypothetical protein HDU98_010566 [Podochytrium sp. JEL0797]|nr:hypothetical protein HDU98_010566 [Podochytrium sp. JEL0797]